MEKIIFAIVLLVGITMIMFGFYNLGLQEGQDYQYKMDKLNTVEGCKKILINNCLQPKIECPEPHWNTNNFKITN